MRYATEMYLQSLIPAKMITAAFGQIQLISRVLFGSHHHERCSLPVCTGPHQLLKPATAQEAVPLFFGLYPPESKKKNNSHGNAPDPNIA